jgi:cell fate regulator YaaT (PSP1 superfamily)
VEFGAGHTLICASSFQGELSRGSYVLTDGDRGFDLGRVMGVAQRLSSRQARDPRIIRRLANPDEISQLAEKARKDHWAREIGQTKVDELGLSMIIEDAQWQFDGGKLTFFYSSPDWVDFRDLQRILFTVFRARIWLQSV